MAPACCPGRAVGRTQEPQSCRSRACIATLPGPWHVAEDKGTVDAPEPKPPGEPLKPWERGVALVVGVLALLSGGIATFKTTNGPGTAVLTLVGAALLFVGIQGTPVIRLGGDNASIELDRRRRAAERVISRVSEEASPEVARSVIEAVVEVEPDLSQALTRAAAGEAYESQVRNALARLGVEGVNFPPQDSKLDLVARLANNRQVGFVVSYAVSDRRVREVFHRYMDLVARGWSEPKEMPVIVVANRIPASSASYLRSGQVAQVVRWDGEEDDAALRDALEAVEKL